MQPTRHTNHNIPPLQSPKSTCDIIGIISLTLISSHIPSKNGRSFSYLGQFIPHGVSTNLLNSQPQPQPQPQPHPSHPPTPYNLLSILSVFIQLHFEYFSAHDKPTQAISRTLRTRFQSRALTCAIRLRFRST
ncbi:hypothetical protein EYC84_001823 [Monilinia fructicola]|uniref:Uncharacterized protein n=1 Tax=Monilinia fructicola TaxID=38448 RepID=A0A5M9JT51_MONFR|nr:hypothetical protein EYC84_001823 [Monilinia fructicola]